MLSKETLESYRRMTPGERLRLTLDLLKSAQAALLAGSPEKVAKRFRLLNLQNDQRNAAMIIGMAKTRNDNP